MKLTGFPLLLLVAAGSYAGGLASFRWLIPAVERPTEQTPATGAASGTDPKKRQEISLGELRVMIQEQELLVKENQRRLEEVLPDVRRAEKRLAGTSEAVRRMALKDAPEQELMRLTMELGGAEWMPDAVAAYQKSQDEYRTLGERYGGKHPKMIASDATISALAERISEETGRVFAQQQELQAELKQSLPGLRDQAAKALANPESWKPLEKNLRESEELLEAMRRRMAAAFLE